MKIYYSNKYGVGHEQRENRPYLYIYECEQYALAFPKTRQKKQSCSYPSHKNFVDKDGCEVMIDQLQVIPKNQYSKQVYAQTLWKEQLQRFKQKQNNKKLKSEIIDHFLQNLLPQQVETSSSNNRAIFGNILNIEHTNPILKNKHEFIVLSKQIFHRSSMCLIAPYQEGKINFLLLHCIDFKARVLKIIGNIKDQLDVSKIRTEIKKAFQPSSIS